MGPGFESQPDHANRVEAHIIKVFQPCFPFICLSRFICGCRKEGCHIYSGFICSLFLQSPPVVLAYCHTKYPMFIGAPVPDQPCHSDGCGCLQEFHILFYHLTSPKQLPVFFRHSSLRGRANFNKDNSLWTQAK